MMYIFLLQGSILRQAAYGNSVADARSRLRGRERQDNWIFQGAIELQDFSCTFIQDAVPMSQIKGRALLAS